MAKPKPNTNNIRQGQTIYYVYVNYITTWPYKVVIESIFLHSQKTPLPPEGSIIEKIPITKAKEWLRRCPNEKLFFSKNQAEVQKKEMQRALDFEYHYHKAKALDGSEVMVTLSRDECPCLN